MATAFGLSDFTRADRLFRDLLPSLGNLRFFSRTGPLTQPGSGFIVSRSVQGSGLLNGTEVFLQLDQGTYTGDIPLTAGAKTGTVPLINIFARLGTARVDLVLLGDLQLSDTGTISGTISGIAYAGDGQSAPQQLAVLTNLNLRTNDLAADFRNTPNGYLPGLANGRQILQVDTTSGRILAPDSPAGPTTPIAPPVPTATSEKTIAGSSLNYRFVRLSNGTLSLKNDSSIDDITGFSTIRFNDRQVDVTNEIKGTFDQVTGLNTPSGQIFRLYNAAFKRLPDANGLRYWINAFATGGSSIQSIAQGFLASKEFADLYGTDNPNSEFIRNLYLNILGRDADASGFSFWQTALNSGTSRTGVLLEFSESAENKKLFSETTGFF